MLLHFRKKCIDTDSKAFLETIKRKKDANEKKKSMPHHCRKRKFNAYKTFNKNDLKIHFYNFLQVHLMGLYMEYVWVWNLFMYGSLHFLAQYPVHLSVKFPFTKKSCIIKEFWMNLKSNYKNLAPIITNSYTRNNYNLRNFSIFYSKN